jgi:tetratricopeptide (TPR) repeat protein
MSRTIRMLSAPALILSACTLLPAPTAADSPVPPDRGRPVAPKELHQHLARASGWVRNTAGGGRSQGTAWVVDAGKKLMVTNDHVVAGADVVEVVFPRWEGGKLVREESEYAAAPRVKAVVIDRDDNRDLALLKLESIPAGTRAVPLAASEPDEGDDIRTIGAATRGGDGLVWGAVAGVVRTVGPQPGAAGGGKVRHVLSTAATNSGNSGAPVVNLAGELVGVHAASKRDAHGVAMHVSVTEVRAFLEDAVPLADPKRPAEYVARGERRLAAGRWDAAAGDFSAALAADPGHAEALYLRGRAFIAKGDPQTAVGDLDAAVSAAPGRYEYRVARGLALRLSGKPGPALADFTDAIRMRPALPDAYNQRGLVHLAAARFAEAEADFTRSIAADGNRPSAYANRADARAGLKQYESAAADWAAAARLAPRDPYYPNALGLMLARAGKVAQAIEAFSAAVEVSNGHPACLTNLGDALRKAGDFRAAAKAYTEAIRALGEAGPAGLTADAYKGRGVARRELKLYRDAVEDLTKAIELVGDKDAGLYLERAMAHLGNGATAAAEADVKTLAKLDPKLAQSLAAAADPLAGAVWRGSFVNNGVRVTMTYTFNRDGTFRATITGAAGGQTETVTDSGTYSVANGRVTIVGKQGTVTRPFTLSGDTAKVTMDEIGLVVAFAKTK